METLHDRFTAWALRLAATGMLFAGLSALLAGMLTLTLLAGASVARPILFIILQLGGALLIGGAAAKHLSRANGRPLPNEQPAASVVERAAVGGWLIALAIALVALPVWLVLRLQPFLAEWARVADLLSTPGLWESANANGSGLILVPLAGVLTPPFLELVAMAAFVVASAVLLPLLLARSPRFPRHYLVCVVMLSALVVAAARGASAAMLAVEAVRPFVDDSNGTPEELAQARDILGRYATAVSATLPALVWTLCGYLVWVPAMLWSQRARTTFADGGGRADAAAPRDTDIESITAPPRSLI